MAATHESEAALLALLDDGALSDAATRLVELYGPEILGYLCALLRDDEAAREAFSEFAEEMWKALPRFERRSTRKTWAYGIAYHCALRCRRARARRRTRPLRDSEYSKIAQSVRSLSASFKRTEAERKLDILRQSLDDEEQTLLVLRVDRKMSWREVADVLAVEGADAEAIVRKRFQRLKQRLRRQVEREKLLS